MEVIETKADPDDDGPTECLCETNLTEHKTVILWLTIPIEVACLALLAFGIVNLIRFKRANQLGNALMQIYFFSLLSIGSSFIWLAFAFKNNVWSVLPLLTFIYAKTIFGIAYQSSVFSLKHLVQFYFIKKEKERCAFTKRKNRAALLMFIWIILMIICYFGDIGFNYIFWLFVKREERVEERKADNYEKNYREIANYLVAI